MAVDIDNPIKSAAVARSLAQQPEPCLSVGGVTLAHVQEDRQFNADLHAELLANGGNVRLTPEGEFVVAGPTQAVSVKA